MKNARFTENEKINTNDLTENDVYSIYQKLEEINMRLIKLEEHFLIPVINNDENKEVEREF